MKPVNDNNQYGRVGRRRSAELGETFAACIFLSVVVLLFIAVLVFYMPFHLTLHK